LSLHDAVAQLVRQRVRTRKQCLHPLGRPERRQGVREAVLSGAHEPAGVVDDQLGAGLAIRAQGTTCADKPLLRVAEAPEPHQLETAHGMGCGHDRIRSPSVRLRDRDGHVRELERL
jgi:hypothetical protein